MTGGNTERAMVRAIPDPVVEHGFGLWRSVVDLLTPLVGPSSFQRYSAA